MPVERLAIVGTALIGGSVGLAVGEREAGRAAALLEEQGDREALSPVIEAR